MLVFFIACKETHSANKALTVTSVERDLYSEYNEQRMSNSSECRHVIR